MMNGPLLSEENLMPRRLPLYCSEDTDRHGNVRIYYRRNGRKIRIRGLPLTEEFMNQYNKLIAGNYIPPANEAMYKKIIPNSWAWLCEEYFKSDDFKELEKSTRKARKSILEQTYKEPIKEGSDKVFEDLPINNINLVHLEVLRDRKRLVPFAANNRVKSIRRVLIFAFRKKLINKNIHRDLERIRKTTEGHKPWSLEWVKLYEDRHPTGSEARRALAIFLNTGVRVSDAVRIGRQHEKKVINKETGQVERWIKFTSFKNRNKSPMVVEIPILSILQKEIDSVPDGQMLYLESMWGKPYSIKGFSNKFKRWCKQAGLPDKATRHGVRKTAAESCAERGATENQMMAIFGWTKSETAQLYLRKARRRKMAGAAMHLIELEGEQETN